VTGSLGAFVLGVGAGLALAASLVALRRAVRPRPDAASHPDSTAEERADIASKITHELRNPIMSVRGLAATGARLYDSMSDDERREFFRLIDTEAARLRQIADETSTALKIDAGRITYDLRPEDLGKLVEGVAWATLVGEHPVAVETEEGLVTPLDRLTFSEALSHLIDNAAKFSPPDAPIEIRAYGQPGGPVVEVVDHGPGIPAEQREAVFARFGKWRPAGYENTPGAGLGLFIARAHVLAHGGRIEAEDAPERGTIMRVTLLLGEG